jgi:hypothetical protein
MTSTHDCQYCKRTYREKFNYDRHLLCCEFLFKSRREQNNEHDLLAPIPTPSEMYQLIQHMSVRIDKLEKENQRLVQVTRRKYNIIEQLNLQENIEKMDMTFSEWIKQHILPEVHNSLQRVYDNDLFEGLKDVITSAINKFDINIVPIRTFDNSTTFYVFNSIENNVKKWIKMPNIDLDKYLRRISNQYWYDVYKIQIETSEKYTDLYLEYHGKVLGGNITEDNLFQKLRKHIFIHVKQSPKSVIEYVA